MQAVAVPLQNLIGQVKNNANSIVFSVLIFSYNVFENEFACSCGPQSAYCTVYITVPCIIVTILMLTTDLPFQRAWTYTTSKGSCHFGCTLIRRTIKALCVGLLWAAAVLLDAEWYVCCRNQNPKVVADLQCKNKSDITPGGKSVVTIAEMKTNSRMYGIALLFGITFVGTFLLSTWTIFADTCNLKCCDRKVLVDELMLEVGEDIVFQAIKEKQKSMVSEKTDAHLKNNEWTECLNVVEDIIEPIEEDEATQDQAKDKESDQNKEQDQKRKSQQPGEDPKEETKLIEESSTSDSPRSN